MLKKIDWKNVIIIALITTALVVGIKKYTDILSDCGSVEPVPEG